VLSRRSLLLGGAGLGVAGLAGGGLGIYEGVVPGRPWLQANLGLNGEAGVVPDVEPGPVEQGTFVSAARGGGTTGWALLWPPGFMDQRLPVVVALHPLGADHRTLTGPTFGLDRFLAAHVEDGGDPFVLVTADGGTSYWHPRPDGEDSGAMVVEELLPMVKDRGVDTGTVGFLGWSMGGYGALRLAGQLGRDHVAAVVAVSPAIWTDPDDASSSGFEDRDEYLHYTVTGHQPDLEGIAVRVDCGTGDPFYRDVQDYVEAFPPAVDVTSTFQPGGHTPAYWRRMLPDQLAFLGQHLSDA
jgi:S-formylglutathione hydrolase FrmB